MYNNNGKPYFSSLDDYISRNTEPASIKAANVLSALINDSEVDYRASLPEYKFLKRFNYVNENYRLVNDKGQLVDSFGRLINDEGEWIDEEGNRVDSEGNKIVEKSVDTAEFFDDEQEPVVSVEQEVVVSG